MSHRGQPKTQAIRSMLRKEAEERQVEYDKLSLQEKLDRLPPAPGAKKQRAKLLALKDLKPVVSERVDSATVVTEVTPHLKAKDRRAQEKK